LTPNDLSDMPERRGTYMVGGKVTVEAGAVTLGVVRCSALDYAACDAAHRSLASKVIADQVPVEHVRDEKDHAKNME